MSKKDAKQFFEMLEKDPAFQFQIANSRNEAECLKAINEHHMQFDEKEFREAFEEKYHRPLKKEELHKLTASGLMPSTVAAKLPYTRNHPHHGD
jgi:hemerythrin-like domain-containing protein